MDWMGKKLEENIDGECEIIMPIMPTKYNAKYSEWKIWFEKLFSVIQDEVTLIGISLGGIFLAKYLSENDFPKKIKAVILAAPPFRDTPDESIGDFVLSESLEKLEKQAEKIFIFHSEDDPVVPFDHLEKYLQKLPQAKKIVLQGKGHLRVEEFPEMVELIRSL